MKYFITFVLSCYIGLVAVAQSFTFNDLPWLTSPPTSSRFIPTSPTNTFLLWAELTPTNGTFGGSAGATVPANDNQDIKYWTNLCGFISGSRWTADQTLHPTNFVSGGGGNGTSPRVLFTAASPTRMVGPTIPDLTNKFTVIAVANCDATSGIDSILADGITGNTWINYNAHKLEMSQGTTISSAATMGAGYYVITVVFAAGASSHIDTNGVLMVSGNAGTANLRSPYIGQAGSAIYHGSICRIWGWYGILNSTDLTAAVHQCGIDFGITTP